MPRFQHQHRPDLDGIRGVLALSVMLLHFGINRFVAPGEWAGFAFGFAVDVFFILSGFVLASSYLASNDRSGLRFAIKRFFRLAPVFYVTTLLVLPIAPTNYRWELLPAELAMGVPFFAAMPVNWPAWSIAWEFYWPLLAFLAAPYAPIPRTLVLPLLLACLAVLALVDVQLAEGIRLYAARAPLGLGAGALLYRLFAQAAPAPGSPRTTYALFAALLAVMTMAKTLPPLAALVPPIAALLVWSGARGPSPLFASRPLQWLGALSYTLYMAHVPVLQAIKGTFGEEAAGDPVVMLVGAGLSFLLAMALTKTVELPGIAFGRTVAQRLAPRRETSEA